MLELKEPSSSRIINSKATWASKNLSYKLIYLFTFGCVGPSLLRAVRGLCLVAGSRGYSSLWCTDFSLCGFSCCGARALGTRASVVVAGGLSSCGLWALEHRLSSCGTQALLLRGMWDLPRPGLEPVSPALAGRFLTTEPPGKPGQQDSYMREVSLVGTAVSWRGPALPATAANAHLQWLQGGLDSLGFLFFFPKKSDSTRSLDISSNFSHFLISALGAAGGSPLGLSEHPGLMTPAPKFWIFI